MRLEAAVAHAKRYPFTLLEHSFLFLNGAVFPLEAFHSEHALEGVVFDGKEKKSIRAMMAANGVNQALLAAPLTPVIAAGSNASPERLTNKYGAQPFDVAIPALRVTLHDLVPVYSAHLAAYGSVPATLQYCPGARAKMFVTWLNQSALARLHETEALGLNYDFAWLEAARFESEHGVSMTGASSYVSRRGCFAPDAQPIRLSMFPVSDCALSVLSQVEMLQLVHARFGHTGTLEQFVQETIADQGLRLRRTSLMAEFGQPFAFPKTVFNGP